MNEKHVNYLSLGKNDADIMTAGTVISQASDMTEGVLAVVNITNTTVTDAQTGKVRIVQRVGDTLIYSPFIDIAGIRAKRGVTGAQSVQQVSYVGYNGTDGAINDAVSSDYIVRLIFKNSREIADWAYKSGTTTSESLISKGLLDSVLNWKDRQFEQRIKCERVAATSSVAVLTGAGVIYKLTKGLKGVSVYTKAVAANAALTASKATVTKGNAIHIASTGAKSFSFSTIDAVGHVAYIGTTSYVIADAGTAADGSDNAALMAAAINAGSQATASVSATNLVTVIYKEHIYGTLPPMVINDPDGTPLNTTVTALSGDLIPVKYLADATTDDVATFDLDVPWQGETGYLYETATAVAASGIGIATLNGDTFGLKFTGIALPHDAETRHYHTVKFTLGIDGDFSEDTPITNSIAGSEGIGTKAQVAIAERQLQMNDGQSWVNAYPAIKYRAVADTMEDTLFPLSTVTIDAVDSDFVPILGDNPKSYYTVTIVTPNSTAYATLGTIFAIS